MISSPRKRVLFLARSDQIENQIWGKSAAHFFGDGLDLMGERIGSFPAITGIQGPVPSFEYLPGGTAGLAGPLPTSHLPSLSKSPSCSVESVSIIVFR